MIVLSSPRAAVIGIWMLTQCGFHPVRTALVGLSGAATGLLPFAPIVRTDSHPPAFHLLPWLAVTGLAIWTRSRLPSRSFAPP